MTRSNLIDVTVTLHHETPQAILVSDSGDREQAIWLPKSMVEFEPVSNQNGSSIYTVTLPDWKAKDAGLI